MKTESTLRLVALIFPIMILAGWVLQQSQIARSGQSVRLKVAAYDPRDLLSGHYLTYRVNYGSNPCAASYTGKEQCVCFSASSSEKEAKVSWSGNCVARPAVCDLWLKGYCGPDFAAGIERFYFPEQYAQKLLRVPENSSIEVHLDGAGKGVVTNFFVNQLPLGEYLLSDVKR